MNEIWHLKGIDWLASLPADDSSQLLRAATASEFAAGDIVFEPDSNPKFVYILQSGLVRTYRVSTRGEEVTFGYIRSGEVFGELAALSDKPRESFAVAVEPSRVIKIDRGTFRAVLSASPQTVLSVATQIEDRFKEIESRVEDLVFRSARSRLARVLLRLGDEFGEGDDSAVRIGLRATHAELATLAGTSRPTVSITLGEFEADGIIVRDDGHIRILDAAALRREAD